MNNAIKFEDHEKLVLHTIIKTLGGINNAKQICNKRNMDLEDLIQVGRIALLKAIKSFNPSKQTKFSTYAVPYIKSYILKELNKSFLIKFPYNMDYKEKIENSKIIHIHAKPKDCDDEETTIENIIPSEYNLENSIVESFYVKHFFEKLTDKEKQVVKLRMKNFSFKEIGEKLNIPKKSAEKAFYTAKIKWKKELEAEE